MRRMFFVISSFYFNLGFRVKMRDCLSSKTLFLLKGIIIVVPHVFDKLHQEVNWIEILF